MEIQLDYMLIVVYFPFVASYLGILTLNSPRHVVAQKEFFYSKSYPINIYLLKTFKLSTRPTHCMFINFFSLFSQVEHAQESTIKLT